MGLLEGAPTCSECWDAVMKRLGERDTAPPPESSVSPEAAQMARDTERAQVVAYLRAVAPGFENFGTLVTGGAAVRYVARLIENAPEPSPMVRSTATEKVCDHSGIGLPGCETCDPNTDRNQDRRRRGESPVCIDCGDPGEPDDEVKGRRWCQACQVRFGWMVPAAVKSGPRPTCCRPDPTFPAHRCILSAGHSEPCDGMAVP